MNPNLSQLISSLNVLAQRGTRTVSHISLNHFGLECDVESFTFRDRTFFPTLTVQLLGDGSTHVRYKGSVVLKAHDDLVTHYQQGPWEEYALQLQRK